MKDKVIATLGLLILLAFPVGALNALYHIKNPTDEFLLSQYEACKTLAEERNIKTFEQYSSFIGEYNRDYELGRYNDGMDYDNNMIVSYDEYKKTIESLRASMKTFIDLENQKCKRPKS